MVVDIVEDWKQDEFYLTKDLTDKNVEMLDKVLRIGKNSLSKFNRRIPEYAELAGKKSRDIVLRNEQVRPMLMSLITKRFFIGDEPGLGKTVMSAACYANYAYHMLRRGKEPTKVLVVTTSSHVNSFAREWESYGIDLLPLTGGSQKIEKTLNKNDIDGYDGLIINWDGLKTNGFLDYYLRNEEKFNYAVFDETSALKKGTSVIYEVAENLVNKYKNGIDRVIFLNGSSFESNLFDFYYQFKVLKPKLIPNKQFLEDNYVIRGGASHFAISRSGAVGNQRRYIQRYGGAIVDYKNQEELRERLQFYFLARSKTDYVGDIPENNYVLHEIDMSAKQRKYIREERNVTLLNSPETRYEELKLTPKNAPKLAYLLEFIETVEKDRPLIYVYNRKSQETVKRELKKLGYKVGLINGSLSSNEKDDIVDKFNRYKLDVLVFNVQKALNIPTSDRIILYDIPIMPHETRQIMGRIDRNNYDTPKFYDFLCYLESPEMENMIKLSLFRESHGSAFTGQESYVYKTIIDQLSLQYGKDAIEEVKERSEEDDDFFDSDEWEELANEIVG